MASSLTAWGVLVLLLCLQHSPLAQSSSRREFLDQHHLNTDKEFFLYSCDALMTEKGLKPKSLHIFVYMPWYKVEHTCISGNWKDRYKNSYVWTQTPVKVLKLLLDAFKKKYTEIKNITTMFSCHCNADGYIDSISKRTMMLMESHS
ncbi:LOW QUALITY PROTEIN: epididymal secretory protein E3-beta [Arvicola amphibius]|uniref:LOW QUALITY PROTEIN: epididymal secretory protein E3-beta n=1 Tax=Arvicola amphibius TaxID=1047088 RepID=UPI0018E37BD2|nr:LOW QUALITY PROTEIN: epididymal secretory protein E3-beta [Arvicola amphibius]